MSQDLSGFNDLYQNNPDPWHYRTSACERQEQDATLRAEPTGLGVDDPGWRLHRCAHRPARGTVRPAGRVGSVSAGRRPAA